MSHKGHLLVDDLPLDTACDFNFDRIVDTLFGFITNKENSTPLSICIDGAWGSGKTSLMRTLCERLKADEEEESQEVVYVPLWFAPWKLSSEEEVLNALVSLVLRRIQDDAGLIAHTGIEVDRKDVFRVLSQRFLQINPDELSTYYQWSSRAKGSFMEVEDLFRKIAEAYLQGGKTERRFVIFIDDLDRCPPSRTVAVLEAVKLFLNIKGFLFVFGMDRDQIEQSVRQSYKHFKAEDADVYLEKMFQLTYALPTKDRGSLVDFLSGHMENRSIILSRSWRLSTISTTMTTIARVYSTAERSLWVTRLQRCATTWRSTCGD